MPIFAFSNAGVIIDFSGISANLMIVLGVVCGLIIGKPLGIFGFTYLFSKLKIIKKPHNLSWNEIFAVGFLGGIGFTMSIFITLLAFDNETIINNSKLVILIASLIAGILGFLTLKVTLKPITNEENGIKAS